MRIPEKPPVFNLDAVRRILATRPLRQIPMALRLDPYLHWEEVKRREPPSNFSREEWWLLTKFFRQPLFKGGPLKDAQGKWFKYALPDPAQALLHQIDRKAGGMISMPDEIINPDTRDRYLISSLMEESIRSSQIEGAATTRAAAKEMLRSRREPRNEGEQMVLNNFRALELIRSVKDQALTPDLIFQLHRMLTEGTLDKAEMAGRFRGVEDHIRVEDHYGQLLHVPPPVDQLEGRLKAMCEFANDVEPSKFLHPVVRAIILHFWLAYDHPFVDGNGRCARALFYWSILRQGYWLFEFISISEIVYKAPVQYQRAFLYTETDDNDLTYFIHYHLELIQKAIEDLHRYLRRKAGEARRLETQLKESLLLNHRQRAILGHALRHPGHTYSIESHRRSHNVVYQTARTDLLDLVKRGFLESFKGGRAMLFRPSRDLFKRLSSAKE